MKSMRFDYVDALRGVMILLVIYVHLISFCIYANTDGSAPSQFAEVMQRVRMPLFFAITGFLSYGICNVETFKRRARNRLVKQLWPTVLIFIIYELICGKGFALAVSDDAKDGYWFTYSLVQVWFFYALLSVGMSLLQLSKRTQFLAVIALTLLTLPAHIFMEMYSNDLFSSGLSLILSFSRSSDLMPFFFIGVMLRMAYGSFERLFAKFRWGGGILLTACTLCLFVKLGLMWNPYQIRISEIVGVIAIFMMFYVSRNYWSGNSMVAKHLCMLGKMTLPIYLFHYFAIYVIRHLHFLDGFASYVGITYIELPVLLSCSILIAQFCVWFDKALTYKEPVHKIVFGA